LREYQTSGHSWVECEQDILGFAHPALSMAAMAVWKVPEPILRAAAEHHSPVPSQAGIMSLGWVLNAANQYVNSLSESILPATKPDAAGSVWMESLGLDREGLVLLLADFQTEHSTIAEYFH
jgi:HD-like signal output (HDOD) protein